MKTKVYIIIPTLFFFLIIGTSRALAEDKVPLGMDGEVWLSLNDAGGLDDESDQAIAKLCKLGIIRGVYDGLLFGQSPIMGRFNTETSLMQLVNALDRFYADDRNFRIPVVVSLWIVSMELSGEPKERIDMPLRELRKSYPHESGKR